jgi:hypothetical protein
MASVDRRKSEKKKFILLAEIAALKKVTQLLQKGYHKCALLFSCGWVRERGVFLCVSLVGEMGGSKSKMADHACFGCPTFKHFSLTSNVSALKMNFRELFLQ